MKSILVPAGGGESDRVVFKTALAAAQPFSAHLRFFHVHVSPGEAAEYTPHTQFAMGTAIQNVLQRLQVQAQERSQAARRHVEDFCRGAGIPLVDKACDAETVSASWCEEVGPSLELLTRKAGDCDLVVMGRTTVPNGLPLDSLERLVLGCGRPIIVAPPTPPATLTGTTMVCWTECARAARAVAAAMPFLSRSQRVVLVSIVDGKAEAGATVNDLADHLGFNGMRPEVRCVARNRQSIAEQLASAGRACGADLIVMGAYGHSRMREILFGGCTQSFISGAESAVLFAH